MSSEEARTKRSAKKPAWMTDEMLIDPAEVEAEVRMMMPKPNPRMMAQHVAPAHHHHHHEVMMPRAMRPSGRMCSNPQCKNPFDSPQWRRGPLGPGTLCNACGTRYARLQAKMNGDKKGKMRPQERAEWEAFEQQRLHPQAAQHQQQQTWRVHMQSFVQREQQQQYYGAQEDEYAGYEESDYGYEERSYGSQQQGGHGRGQQHYTDAEQDMHDPDGTEAYQDGLSDSPDVASRAAIAAAVAAAAAAAAAGARPTRPMWRGSRQHMPSADAATDSQEDEAAAYSCQEGPAGMDAAAAAAAGGSPAGPSFLHLLAVGQAMIKTENVAPQERRAAYTEVVGKGMGPEPERAPAGRAAGGEVSQGVKRSRFALEAEEQQGARPSSAAEPTALQRALERCGTQAAPPRAKPAGSEHTAAADRFERLLAEAEACVRARSVSPCMLKGMPGPGASPITGTLPAARPITPLQLGVNAVDAAAGRAGLAGFMLPAAAMPRRPASAAAGASGRHSSLAQALAAAAAAEVSSPGEEGEGGGMGMQGSPHSQYDVTASNAGSAGHRGDAARAFDAANIDASYGAAGSSLPHDLQGHMQALLGRMGQMQSTEPSPVSKMLLADEVLSPTTMHMPSARPRKQPRTVGPEGIIGAASASGAGGSLQLQRSGTPGDGAAANTAQSDLLQQQMAAQSILLRQAQGQQAGLTSAPMPGPLPTAAELQQAGHRPVVLACQLVLQQQANPTALRPLFAAPGGSASPLQPRQGNSPGLGANAELVSSALQLAQAGSGGNTQTHLDQLKAVTMSAQAAAATASAVAAATALLWQQLQQQEHARARQQEQPEEPGQDLQPSQGQAGRDAGADADIDAAAAGGGDEPAPPGSPVADPAAAAQGASGSISRSSSSSTSAAGLSAAAPGDSHGVDKPPAAPAAATDQQQQAPACTTPGPSPAAGVAAAAAGGDCPSAAGADPAQVTSFGHPEQQPAGEQMRPAVDGPATGPGAVQQA